MTQFSTYELQPRMGEKKYWSATLPLFVLIILYVHFYKYKNILSLGMRFEWDQGKNRQNQKRHGFSFETAIEVFDDPFCLVYFDRHIDGEERYWTIGRLGNLVVVVVVHTISSAEDEEVFRIISARKATPRERRFYEEDQS